MIVQLTGTLVEVLPSHVVIDVGGVGYELGVSATTAASLPAVGEAGVTVLTRMLVKENSVELYGFATREERAVSMYCERSRPGATRRMTCEAGSEGEPS